MALFLLALKIFAAAETGSVALLGSLADTAFDVLASLLTLFSVRYAARPADDDHRFGHGKAEAIVIATACSPVPEGRATWTARMLATRLVELQVVESVSEDTILRVLKKATSSRGRRSRGPCPRA